MSLDQFQNVLAQGWGGMAVNVDTGKRGGHPRNSRCTDELSGKLSAIMTNSTSTSNTFAKLSFQVTITFQTSKCQKEKRRISSNFHLHTCCAKTWFIFAVCITVLHLNTHRLPILLDPTCVGDWSVTTHYQSALAIKEVPWKPQRQMVHMDAKQRCQTAPSHDECVFRYDAECSVLANLEQLSDDEILQCQSCLSTMKNTKP